MSETVEPKFIQLIGNRGGTGLAGSDTLPVGRGQHSFYASLGAASKQRKDLFSGSIKSRNLSIKEGYSFTGGEGKVLVDTISYRGNDTNPDGTINIYQAAAKEEEPDTGPDPGDDDPDTGNDDGGENVDDGPDYNQMINDALANIPSISDITDAIRLQNEASEERIRAMNEENRKLYINDQRNRASESRTPNLQIRGAGETPKTAGSQGFRRRTDQFRIAPFQGISGALGVMGQVAQNKLVNI